MNRLSDNEAIRAILTPVLAFLKIHHCEEGTLPTAALGFGIPFSVSFADARAAEVSMTITPKRGRQRLGIGDLGGKPMPLILVRFGEGKQAPSTLRAIEPADEGPGVPTYVAHLAAFLHRMRHATARAPTVRDQAARINAAYGATPRRGPRVQVKGFSEGLALTVCAPVTPEQAHVMLAAARLCGLLGPDTEGGGQTAQAVSTLLSSLQLPQATPAPPRATGKAGTR